MIAAAAYWLDRAFCRVGWHGDRTMFGRCRSCHRRIRRRPA